MDAKTKLLLTGLAVAVGTAGIVHIARANNVGGNGGVQLAPTDYPMVLGTSGYDKFDQNYYAPDIPNYLRDPTMYLTYNTPPWTDAQFGSAPTYNGGDTVIVGGESLFSYNSPMDMRSLTINGGDCGCCCPGDCGATDDDVITAFRPQQQKLVGQAQQLYMSQKYADWLDGLPTW